MKNTTVNKADWLKTLDTESGKRVLESLPGSMYDLKGVEYLEPVIEGYMTQPVAVYNSKPIEARTLTFTNISEVLDNMLVNGERIIMYMLIWIPSMPIYDEISKETFELVKLDKPAIRYGAWKMRYGKL